MSHYRPTLHINVADCSGKIHSSHLKTAVNKHSIFSSKNINIFKKTYKTCS